MPYAKFGEDTSPGDHAVARARFPFRSASSTSIDNTAHVKEKLLSCARPMAAVSAIKIDASCAIEHEACGIIENNRAS